MVKTRLLSRMDNVRSLFSPKAVGARNKSFSPTKPCPNTTDAMKENTETCIDVAQVQKELSDLRERVKILDGDTGHNELLDKLKDREEQLRSLNDKFHNVHKGLIEIDEERQKLRQEKNELEQKNKVIERQLDVREKEVFLLTKRCSSQAEKMRESSRLRASNNELTSEMEGLRSNLTLREEELSQIDSLRRQLKECQDSREELLKRLAKVKKDHDDIAGTLNSCFETIQKLNESKAEVEEERRREAQRVGIEIEKQRLAHLEATDELRTEVLLRQDRIEQMEQILKDNIGTCTILRKEKAEWNRVMQHEIAKLKEEHAAERTALNDENAQAVQNLHEKSSEMLSQLRTKLEEKESIVSSLEDEVSHCMHKMMGLATDLHHLQEMRRDEASKHKATVDKLEKEQREMQGLLCARDSDITELSESVIEYKREKELLKSELADLRKRVQELEEENAFIMSLEDQLHEVNTSVTEVKEQRCHDAEEHETTVALLQQELEDERQMWSSMELGLQAKISSLEEEKQLAQEASQSVLAEARNQLQLLEDSSISSKEALLECLKKLDSERETRANIEKEVTSLQQLLIESQTTGANDRATIDLLKSELAVARKTLESLNGSGEERISALRAEFDCARKLYKADMEGNKQAMEFKEQALSLERSKLQELRDVHTREVACLQESLHEAQTEISMLGKQLSEAHEALRKEATSSRRNLSEKDATIASLTEEMASLRTEIKEIESALREAGTRHKDVAIAKAELEALQLEHRRVVTEREWELKSREDALTALTTELDEVRLASDREIITGNQRLAEQKSLVSALQSELEETRAKVEEGATRSRQSMTAMNEALSSLKMEMEDLKLRHEEALAIVKADLDASQLESQRLVTERESELKSKEDALENLSARFEELHLSSKGEIAAGNEKLSEQAYLISVLKSELAETRAKAEEEAAVSKQIMTTKNEVLSSLNMEMKDLKLASQETAIIASESLKTKEKLLAATQAQLKESREEYEQATKSLKDALADREKTISSLRVELENVRHSSEQTEAVLNREVEAKCKSLASLEKQLTEACETSQMHLAASESTLKENDETIASLRTELSEARQALERNTSDFLEILATSEKSVAAANTKMELARSDLERCNILAKESTTQKDAVISSLQADLNDLRRATEAEQRMSRAARQVNEESIVSLQSELTQVRLASERDLSILKEDIAKKADTIQALTTELKDLRQARESDVSILQQKMDAKDDMLSKMKGDLDDLLISSDIAAKNFREQVACLKIENQKASTILAIKEDEIRELKLIDLKDAEDTITSLESKLASARESASQHEAEAAEATTRLKSQIVEQKTMNVYLERKLSDMSQQHIKATETLNNELATLKQAKEELESDLKELSTKLQERHGTISVLTRKNMLLEQREFTLQAQLNNAAKDLRKANEEQEKTLAALDREITRQRTNHEDNDISFQRRCSILQKDLSGAEAKLSQQKEKMAEVERILEERTQLLGNMVSHNKETEDEKTSALARVAELEAMTARLLEANEATENELSQLRDLQQKREDQLLEKIHDEQHLREVAEADLEVARSKLSRIRRGSKDADELEKENMVLKDKVRRQEDYLKRKLQKDKVLRDRNSKSVTATPSRIASPRVLRERKSRNVMATPSRIASPTKRRPVPSSIGGSTTKSLIALSETSSFPDEWETNSQY